MHRLVSRGGLARAWLSAVLTFGLGACGDDDDGSDNGDTDGGGDEDSGANQGGGDGGDNGDANNGDANNGDGDAGPDVVGDSYGLTSAGKWLLFNRASGKIESSGEVTGLGADESLVGGDVRPADGKLYALSNTGKLYAIDLATGEATLTSTLAADASDATSPYTALSGTSFGVDFNPVVDRLRVVSDDGQNLRINADTGATNTDTALTSLNVTAAGYSESFSAACRTRLYVVDSMEKTLLLQDPPNDGKLTTIGSLGAATFAEVTSFEIYVSATGNQGVLASKSTSDTQLWDVDLATGAASNPRSVTLAEGESLIGMGVLPPATAPAQGVGELLGLTAENHLVSFNRGAPGKLCSNTAITGLAASENALGMDVRPADGALYVLGSTGKLYTVAVDTGAATLKSTLVADAGDTTAAYTALTGTDFAVGFNPVPDRLRVISNDRTNLRINVDTGATFTDEALDPSTAVVTAAAYTNSFAGAKSTTLYGIDSGTDALVLVGANPATGGTCPTAGNPNCGVVTSVGALGADVSAVNAFDIDGKTGAAFASFVVGTATTSSLYSIDLATGAATVAGSGTIGGGQPLRGLAFTANVTLSAYALTSTNHLLAFSPTTPGTPSADLTITGLEASETLLGIDVRTADGKLYALGSASRLYTIDTATGAATLVSALRAASGDDNPFATLDATGYGIDFNPVADLLRAVNANADNLRIVPSARTPLMAGDVFTDADLNPSVPDIRAAGYTNSFTGTTSTTLYVIDTTSDSLFLQGGLNSSPSPNTGTLTLVGVLGVAAEGEIGFDIVGGHNGLALAAIKVTAETDWKLYSLSLGAGTATAFNAADNSFGTAQVTGLALGLK